MTIEISAEDYIAQLKAENEMLRSRLAEAEPKSGRHKKTDEERAAEFERRVTGLKSNGGKIARPAEPIASYSHYQELLDYFDKRRNAPRNKLLVTLGIAMGLRISDLCELRWGNFLDDDSRYRERTYVVERKTGKLNGIIITDAIKKALTEYRLFCGHIAFDDFVFTSRKSSSNDTTKDARENRKSFQNSLSMLLYTAGQDLGFEEKLSSHSLRKTFVSVIEATYTNTYSLDKLATIQSLLNHSDATTTMRYTGLLDKEKDTARQAVSDWLLGKTDVDELVALRSVTNDDLMAQTEKILVALGITDTTDEKSDCQMQMAMV